ncbi:uncharacterized protein BYT42DRAFT_583190 [Radiomyces spectabilis]|uniref:uncharacterized protein n=1 Tax=Radiomyces spectabilis TaxID=64574 RepID=UPI00221F83EE|nr:uncharacterized protein BYT42DRAFT_583190 [Radiomyces spectabilis]KAI8370650.1 hypothetical protein BYT42DRAFT_583190 [Radiomyces spectabilis]
MMKLRRGGEGGKMAIEALMPPRWQTVLMLFTFLFKRATYERVTPDNLLDRTSSSPSLRSSHKDDDENDDGRASITNDEHPLLSTLIPSDEINEVFLYKLIFCVCIGGFLFGYDTGVISGALPPLREHFHMTTRQEELVVGATTLGAIFGGLFAGSLANHFGRKALLLVASFIFFIGSLIMALASTYTFLLLGRLVVGVGVGIASMIIPLYVSEISPKSIRGRLSTMNVLILTFGQMFAYAVNMVFANVTHGWRFMVGLGALPALVQLCVLPSMPESPRHDVFTGKMARARSTLQKVYHASMSPEAIDDQLADIQRAIDEGRSSTFSDLCRYPHVKALIIACTLQAAQQLSGFNTAMYYAATILRMAGFRDHQNSTNVAMLVAGTNMVFTAVAVCIVDKLGRRRILLVTMLVMMLALIALGSSFAVQQGFVPKQSTCAGYASTCARCVQDTGCGWSISRDTCVPLLNDHLDDIYQGPTGCPAQPNDTMITVALLLSLVIYVASYALGLGYAPWLIQSELFPTAIRGKANGISTATNWLCNLFISSTFLSLTNLITTAGTFWLYAGISLVLWFVLLYLLPETAGKSLEEVIDRRPPI